MENGGGLHFRVVGGSGVILLVACTPSMTGQTATALDHDERSVSPVTGAILTIAITIVLAAAITGFMLAASSAVS